MRRSRFTTLFVAIVLGLTIAAPATAESFPDVISLPDGFFPEGIAVGDGHTVYAGSLVDGAIWSGDLRTGEGGILVPGVDGRIAVGMDYDESTGYLYVAGGPDGNGYIYDGGSGDTVAIIDLVAFGFVNDVIVTQDAAYFTDSFAPQYYVVPLTSSGEVAGPPQTVALGGDFQFAPGQFNANGIEATQSGNTLILVNSFFGELYTLEPGSGDASAIDLGGAVVNGDGLVLVGRTLYAVENFKNQIAEIALAADLSAGEVTDLITSSDYDIPTTAARFGSSLYAVNAKFSTPPLPTTAYEIVRVDR